MKEQRKNFYLLLIILSLIALFLISCDNKDKTGAEEVKKEERTLSYYAGNWYGKLVQTEMHLLTINTDGSFTIKGVDGDPDLIIPSSSVTRVSNTHYTTIDPTDGTKYIFIFSSDTQGKFTTEASDGQSSTIDITKK